MNYLYEVNARFFSSDRKVHNTSGFLIPVSWAALSPCLMKEGSTAAEADVLPNAPTRSSILKWISPILRIDTLYLNLIRRSTKKSYAFHKILRNALRNLERYNCNFSLKFKQERIYHLCSLTLSRSRTSWSRWLSLRYIRMNWPESITL